MFTKAKPPERTILRTRFTKHDRCDEGARVKAVQMVVFARPELARRQLAAVREYRPDYLLIACDAARPGVEGEAARVSETRNVFETIDWPCHVVRDYLDVNVGPQQRFSSAYEKTTTDVEQAIFFEDDVEIGDGFFDFMDAMLDRYKDTPRVTSISGCSHVRSSLFVRSSYYFSRYPEMWGWAAFRRSFAEVNWNPDPEEVASRLAPYLNRPGDVERWKHVLELVESKAISTWDYQFIVTQLLGDKLSVVPRVALSRNIGFGLSEATHTTIVDPFFARPPRPLQGPIKHPRIVEKAKTLDILRSFGTFPPQQKVYAKLRPVGQRLRERLLNER
jgi:hypothetical protein